MDFDERIRQLGAKASKLKVEVGTEEATKNALIMPFISALGYDVFDPREVVPEFIADSGTKKGEKVDYAILKDGQPIMLFECKCCGDALDEGKCSQLSRYFTYTPARIAILTDGIVYKFFSDIDKQNIMDSKPYMSINLESLDDSLIPELKKLSKDNFDLDETLSSANELKYIRALKILLAEEWKNPSDEFIRFLAKNVYQGKFTQRIKEWFTDVAKIALREFLKGAVNQRLETALSDKEDDIVTEENEQAEDESNGHGIITTEDEVEGYLIVKSILRQVVDVSRIYMRDTKSYCGILLDDNNRKPICRLHFNRSQKYIQIFSAPESGKIAISSLDDIFSYSDVIRDAVQQYEKG